jgi:hypothetical protein
MVFLYAVQHCKVKSLLDENEKLRSKYFICPSESARKKASGDALNDRLR